MRYRNSLILLGLIAALAFGHGSTEDQPPPQDPAPPPPGRRRDDPRQAKPPPIPPPEFPPGPTTPGKHDAEPKPAAPAPDGGGPPPVPQPENPKPPEIRPKVRPDILTRPRSSGSGDWRVWWEFNREHLLGLRELLRRKVTITGTDGARLDALGEHRAKVLGALRAAARRDPQRLVQAAALMALGRMGRDEDARLIVDVLKDKSQPQEVHEAAAVALGLLPEFKSEASRKGARDYIAYAMGYDKSLPSRARGMLFLAGGLRARHDATLKMDFLGRAAGPFDDGQEAAQLAYACGLLGDRMVTPELLDAARRGAFGGKRLTDIERAHAVTALGLLHEPAVVPSLVKILQSRRSGINTRRSAALALGRLLRETPLSPEAEESAARALRMVFEKHNDTPLRGFCAVSLGCARTPRSLPTLMEAIDHGGNMDVKPYCALALGLAARTLGRDDSKKVRLFLGNELEKTNHADLGAALSIALGLAHATEAEETLRMRLTSRRLTAFTRGAAAQGLGLLETPSPETTAALVKIVKTELSGRVLADAVLALGLLGQRDIARDLVDVLPKTSSSQVQGRIMLALHYLNHSDAVEPLLAVLGDQKNKSLVREFAVVALGLMGDRREEDLLFWSDAWFNLFATTRATHEWARLY